MYRTDIVCNLRGKNIRLNTNKTKSDKITSAITKPWNHSITIRAEKLLQSHNQLYFTIPSGHKLEMIGLQGRNSRQTILTDYWNWTPLRNVFSRVPNRAIALDDLFKGRIILYLINPNVRDFYLFIPGLGSSFFSKVVFGSLHKSVATGS